MADKIRVGILFGGRSAEHEISLLSAKNIIDALNREKYDMVLIGIDKKGQWRLNQDSLFLLDQNNPELIKLEKSDQEVVLPPGKGDNRLIDLRDGQPVGPVDVVFPVLHGPYGEDGTIQGLLKLADIPFVGAGVLGSAVAMDKDVMKRLLRDAGIPTAKFLVTNNFRQDRIGFRDAREILGLPLFVKPANLGSSIGISKVNDEKEFRKALENAFSYDTKVLLEEAVNGREIECSVLGNDDPIASLPGEVITRAEFYSYEAKYIDENGAMLVIPAELDKETIKNIQSMAVEAFRVLCCEGMARVDFFLGGDNAIIVNEINTIPGFTRISMYPKLWEASGISYPELLERLIQLALSRHEREKKLSTEHI
jgi:D-alanine-D-alanine ligase